MIGVCVCFAVTPPDLMDPGSTMWHPSHRKSLCSSCSQASFSDGAAPRGCNHERWEGLLGNTYYSSLVPNRELQPVTKRKTITWHLRDWCENVFRKLADKPVRWNGLKLGLKKQAISLFVPYLEQIRGKILSSSTLCLLTKTTPGSSMSSNNRTKVRAFSLTEMIFFSYLGCQSKAFMSCLFQICETP